MAGLISMGQRFRFAGYAIANLKDRIEASPIVWLVFEAE